MPEQWRFVLPLAFALSACATGSADNYSDSKLGYVPYSEAEKADWTDAEPVTVTLAERADKLVFESGRVYRLELQNKGESTHFFAAEDFFKASVTETLKAGGGSMERPLLKAVALAPGETKELLILPVRPGTYALECTAPFHRALGMSGTITVM